MKSILKFLKQLKANNDRVWFNDNKDKYLEVKEKVDSLAEKLIAAVAEVDPSAARLKIGDVTYRIYRDTRFSPDKTPYKTHIGIFVNPPYGKKSQRFGYYLHIEPGNCFFCAGQVCLPSPVVNKLRRAVYDNIEEFREIVESPEFSSLYKELGNNPVKTAPRGYDPSWPWIEYIRPRDFIAVAPLSEEFISSPSLIDNLSPYIKQAARFNNFFNYSLEEE